MKGARDQTWHKQHFQRLDDTGGQGTNSGWIPLLGCWWRAMQHGPSASSVRLLFRGLLFRRLLVSFQPLDELGGLQPEKRHQVHAPQQTDEYASR